MAPGKRMKELESPYRGLAFVSDMTIQTPQEKGSHKQTIYGCFLLQFFHPVLPGKGRKNIIRSEKLSAPERRIMQIEKMPLDDRLARMLNGYAAYTEYIPCVLRSFASMPASDYLASYEGKWERLCELLGITELADKDRMTYQEAATLIHRNRTENKEDLSMVEAIAILSVPFRDYFEGRDETHGKNKADTP